MTTTGELNRRVEDQDTSAASKNISFEIRSGVHLVRCGVAAEALDVASGFVDPSTPALRRRSFDRFRSLINEAALIKFRAQAPDCLDPILVTSADLRRVPPKTGSPKFGTFGRTEAVALPSRLPVV